MNTAPDHMPDRWRKILQRHAAGEDFRCAAKAEGCSPSYVKVLKTRMWKNPAAVRLFKQIQTAGTEAAGKTLADRLAQADEDRAFARQQKVPMAAHKSTELQCRLEGRLIEEIHLKTENVNLRGALLESQTRVIGKEVILAVIVRLLHSPAMQAALGRVIGNAATQERVCSAILDIAQTMLIPVPPVMVTGPDSSGSAGSGPDGNRKPVGD